MKASPTSGLPEAGDGGDRVLGDDVDVGRDLDALGIGARGGHVGDVDDARVGLAGGTLVRTPRTFCSRLTGVTVTPAVSRIWAAYRPHGTSGAHSTTLRSGFGEVSDSGDARRDFPAPRRSSAGSSRRSPARCR